MKLRLSLTALVLLAPPILAWAAGDLPAGRGDSRDGHSHHGESARTHDDDGNSQENFESKEVTAPHHAEHGKKEETGSRRMREAGHFNERY